ncbi:MAG: hypothetical protein IKZ45_07300, partial [Fibrobacter sp.]|nr:hypothetical protein [Fibrobacter sp.]
TIAARKCPRKMSKRRHLCMHLRVAAVMHAVQCPRKRGRPLALFVNVIALYVKCSVSGSP